MAALLVSLAVMAVLMSVALPVWRHEAQREKEEELVFRGQQYVRAIRLYNTKTQTLPASIDQLVQGRYIRKKFKDPVTGEDFVPIPAAGAVPGQGTVPLGVGASQGRAGQPSQPSPPGRGGTAPAGGGLGTATQPQALPQSTSTMSSSSVVPGGMSGVMSKSKQESIRLYQGRNHYNEWAFLFVNQAPGGIAPGGGRGQPGGPGGQGVPGLPGGGRGRGADGRGRGGSPLGAPGSGFPGGPGRGRE
jgi:type II secretory pathway pseudopilin PulG